MTSRVDDVTPLPAASRPPTHGDVRPGGGAALMAFAGSVHCGIVHTDDALSGLAWTIGTRHAPLPPPSPQGYAIRDDHATRATAARQSHV